ncbi:MAG TPA: tetratricopeptide repeat protein [Anaerolineales bacterium]|nr:tetratricopeptide repeat protein [Anaerolineales bacterium]
MKIKPTNAVAIDNNKLDDRVDILFRELELAIRWKRPSILLAVFSSTNNHGDIKTILKNRLHGVGQDVHSLRLDDEISSDLPNYLTNLPNLDQKVIFVEGFNGGGREKNIEAYRYLNISRDYFINRKVRVVFWLTSEEANDLARYSPEFWGFRHRVVEFLDLHDPKQSPLHSLGTVWQGIGEFSNGMDEVDEKISLRNSILADLPDMDESTSARANLFISLGVLYWRKGEMEKAIGNSKKALELASKLDNKWFEAFCYNSMALIHANTGKVSESIEALEHAVELVPDQYFPLNNLGNLFSELDRFDEAMVAFRTVIQRNPRDPMSLNGMGTVYYRQGKTKEAYRNFTQAIQAAPTFAHPWIGLGNIYNSQNQTEAAISAYQKAIDLDRHLALPWINIGSLFEKLNRLDDAAQAFQNAFDLDPTNPVTWNAQGKIYMNTGCFDEAVCAFEKSIDLDHGNGWSYVNLAQTYVCKGKYDEAIKLYHQSIRLFKTRTEKAITWSKLGNIYQLKNDIQNAIAAKKIALELDPDNEHLKNELFEIHNSLKSSSEPGDPNSYPLPEMEHIALGRFLQGSTLVNQGLNGSINIGPEVTYPQDSSPNSAFTWNEIGNKHLNKMELGKAKRAYQKAIELDEHYGWPYANLASISVKQERFEKALPLYHQSLRHLKTRWEKAVIWNRLGNIYRKQNDFKKAIQAHRKALELDPKNIPALQDLVRIHNDLEQVRDTISQLANSLDKAVAWDMLGNAYLSLSDYESSVDAFQHAVDLAPNDFAYRFDLEEARKACDNQLNRSRKHKKSSGNTWIQKLLQALQGKDIFPSLRISHPGPLGELIDLDPGYSENKDIQIEKKGQGKPSSGFPIGGPSTNKSNPLSKTNISADESQEGSFSIPPFLQKLTSGVQDLWRMSGKTDEFPATKVGTNPNREHKLISNFHDAELVTIGSGLGQGQIMLSPGTSPRQSANNMVPVYGKSNKLVSVSKPTVGDTVMKTPPWEQKIDPIRVERDILRYQTVTSINPQNARAWYTLGDLYRSVGRLEESVSALEKAASIDPSKEVYLYHLGKAYAAQFRIDDAIETFKKVIAINPQYSLAHATLAGFYHTLGKKREYRQHMSIAREAIKDENDYNRACLEALCGNAEDSVALLKTALQEKQVTMEWVARDPDFDGIRNEQIFIDLVKN